MTPQVFRMLEMVGNAAQDARTACSQCLAGNKLPENVANHLIGIASYIDAMAREIKSERDKECT